ncbi:uncharacterized protein BT62DRAFT_923666 [Guyanagaster necrorhizus]|uniref:Uncharacterized protein n=1 Tax=Guyanagaster necrorhizus TaxID=856835 RepID=A0A9P8AMJ1_9AGAR|nr:uncharacterized protein BT62DRAFT_923666 [Guyanagaster necrorhizus MCA 3950]KAG7440960.1 hypothetical protein BT62DRAFT_923666 [Guyanagaster necrorhizus MCA 3950]
MSSINSSINSKVLSSSIKLLTTLLETLTIRIITDYQAKDDIIHELINGLSAEARIQELRPRQGSESMGQSGPVQKEEEPLLSAPCLSTLNSDSIDELVEEEEVKLSQQWGDKLDEQYRQLARIS